MSFLPRPQPPAWSFSLSPAQSAIDGWLRWRTTTARTSFSMALANASFIGGIVQAIMKSCHTITPFSSHQSKNASGSYTPPPHTRTRLQLRSAIIGSVHASCAAWRDGMGSSGIQSTPRT